MEVYFLRHGDAGAAGDWKGSDAERPLSKDGAAQMEKEAAAIARLGLRLDTILTSPLVRARQTAEIVTKELQLAQALVVEKRLAPGFGTGELQRILKERRAARGLLLVGHEPDFSLMVAELCGGGRVLMKKAGLAEVDVQPSNPSWGTLVWLAPPRSLTG